MSGSVLSSFIDELNSSKKVQADLLKGYTAILQTLNLTDEAASVLRLGRDNIDRRLQLILVVLDALIALHKQGYPIVPSISVDPSVIKEIKAIIADILLVLEQLIPGPAKSISLDFVHSVSVLQPVPVQKS